MRISCAAPRELVSDGLLAALKAWGIEPIITSTIIRVVYEGDDHKLGTKIVQRFMGEVNHDITVDYCDEHPNRNRRRP